MSDTAVQVAGEIAAAMGIPFDVPMTDEQAQEFKTEFARRMGDPSLRHEIRLLPPGLYVGTATHIAGPEVQAGSHVRQRCAWCGVILADTRTHGPAMWAPGDLVRNDRGAWFVLGREEGAGLPADSCAVTEADALTAKYGPPRTTGG